MTIYGQIAANQPTVPSVGNASTVYSQAFTGSQTSLNYSFYLLTPTPCASPCGAFEIWCSLLIAANETSSSDQIYNRENHDPYRIDEMPVD